MALSGESCLAPLAALSRDTVQQQDFGPEIAQDLADPLGVIASQGMVESALKQRMEGIKIPSNLLNLAEVPVNTEIWRTLPGHVQAADGALQQVHNTQAKGLIPIIMIADQIIKHLKRGADMPEPETVLAHLTNGLGLIMASNNQLHRERRRRIQPELKECYRGLGKKDNPIKGHLFGPDLNKQVKELEESNKVVNNLTRNNSYTKNKKPFFNRRQNNIFRKGQKNFFLGNRNQGNYQKPRQGNQGNFRGKPNQQRNQGYRSNTQSHRK